MTEIDLSEQPLNYLSLGTAYLAPFNARRAAKYADSGKALDSDSDWQLSVCAGLYVGLSSTSDGGHGVERPGTKLKSNI